MSPDRRRSQHMQALRAGRMSLFQGGPGGSGLGLEDAVGQDLGEQDASGGGNTGGTGLHGGGRPGAVVNINNARAQQMQAAREAARGRGGSMNATGAGAGQQNYWESGYNRGGFGQLPAADPEWLPSRDPYARMPRDLPGSLHPYDFEEADDDCDDDYDFEPGSMGGAGASRRSRSLPPSSMRNASADANVEYLRQRARERRARRARVLAQQRMHAAAATGADLEAEQRMLALESELLDEERVVENPKDLDKNTKPKQRRRDVEMLLGSEADPRRHNKYERRFSLFEVDELIDFMPPHDEQLTQADDLDPELATCGPINEGLSLNPFINGSLQ